MAGPSDLAEPAALIGSGRIRVRSPLGSDVATAFLVNAGILANRPQNADKPQIRPRPFRSIVGLACVRDECESVLR